MHKSTKKRNTDTKNGNNHWKTDSGFDWANKLNSNAECWMFVVHYTARTASALLSFDWESRFQWRCCCCLVSRKHTSQWKEQRDKRMPINGYLCVQLKDADLPCIGNENRRPTGGNRQNAMFFLIIIYIDLYLLSQSSRFSSAILFVRSFPFYTNVLHSLDKYFNCALFILVSVLHCFANAWLIWLFI